MRLNNEAYTAYPSEGEMLMREGIKIYILGVERAVKIDNLHHSFAQFHGQTINIIHLFHFRHYLDDLAQMYDPEQK